MLHSYALVGLVGSYAAMWIAKVLLVFMVESGASDGPGRVLTMTSADFLDLEVQLAALAMGAAAGAIYWPAARATRLAGVRGGS